MSPTKESSLGHLEPVWVLRAKKKGDNNSPSGDDASSGKTVGLNPIQYHRSDNYLSNDPTPATKDGHGNGKTAGSKGKDEKKETTVVLKVNMCCGDCADTVKVAIGGLKGVKSVDCNWFKERVTVVATTAAPADILLACRKRFKTSRMWNDDD